MTKEELLKEFLIDHLVAQKGYITREEVTKLKFSDHSDSKLINTIKTAILGKSNGESVNTLARKLNKYLNK